MPHSISRLKTLVWLRDPLAMDGETGFAYKTLSLKQKLVIVGLLIIGSLSILAGLWLVNRNFTSVVATSGGELTEGIVGSPRFINPLLAISDADRDLTALVYSGLLKLGPEGELIPDLAENYEISDDSRTYTFTLKEGLIFHDGRKLSARDVVFTVLKAQDAAIRSSRFAAWEGVRVEQVGGRTVIFTLARPYAPFLENLTLGILPTHLWAEAPAESFSFSDLNVNPVGSGPYKIKKIKKDNSGVPIYYQLEPFSNYALGQPKIKILRIHFYPNENELLKALAGGEIEAAAAITPEKAASLSADREILTEPLPRIFGVFFNQNQAAIFTHREVRQALALAAPRTEIIDRVLAGFGLPLDSPLLPKKNQRAGQDQPAAEQNLDEARAILENNGWAKNKDGILAKKTKDNVLKLEFSIATSDTAELKQIAEIVKAAWEVLGAKVELKIFDAGNLNQTIIRPRRYDALLFGLVLGRQPDLYAFWHSSGRLDPGLNIALYTNITADKLLEDLRTTLDPEIREGKLEELAAEIENDRPAVFLYAPKFTYAVPKKIKNISINHLADSSERFAGIHNWYIKTDRIWNFLIPDQA